MDQNVTNNQTSSTIQHTEDPQQRVTTVQKIQEPENPIGGQGKEQGPIVQAPLEEIIKPSEAEPVIAPEVDHIISTTANIERIQIPPEQKAVGIVPAKADVPINASIEDKNNIMDEETAKNTLKKKKVADSARWLATLILEEWLKKRIMNKDKK